MVAILAVAEAVPGRKRPIVETQPEPEGPRRPGPRGPVCWTKYDTVYNTVYENQCTNHYQQSCTITSYRQECVTEVDNDNCFDNFCNFVPRETCKKVPERNCHSVPRQSCQNIPKRIAAQVERQVCSG